MSERLKRTGAVITTVVALGGLSLRSAEARPSINHEPSRAVDANRERLPKVVPDGVYHLVDGNKIKIEAQTTVNRLQKQWNGVLVIHEPKKNASVEFNESPHAYGYSIEGFSSSVEPEENNVMIAVQPGIEKVNGREYAAVYSYVARKWGFLDIKWAADNGALSTYAFRGSSAKPIPYSPSYLPNYQHLSPNPSSTYNPRAVADMNGKFRRLVPSSVTPHS